MNETNNNHRTFDTGQSWKNLTLSTVAFTICFAAWMMNGVLVTYLVDNNVFSWGPVQLSWLIGIPVLTGAIFRLPLGILTDKYHVGNGSLQYFFPEILAV